MKLIVGLGNPGEIYADSRHNIGFLVVKELSRTYKVSFKKVKGISSLSTKAKIDNQNVILTLPLTFMNLSGLAVKALLKKYRIDLDNLLVVCDDLDLEFGRLRLRPSGSSAGHGGLKSIIEATGNRGFSRLRIGIARPILDIDVAEYVLSPFNRKEKQMLKKIIERAVACCKMWVSEGVSKSMNIFNQMKT